MQDERDLWSEVGRLPGGGKDPFAVPFGPTAECFSDNDVVRLFQLGAERRAVSHLKSCADCRRRIDVFARVTRQALQKQEQYKRRAVAAAGLRPNFWQRWRGASGHRPPGTPVAWPRALLYAPDVCEVEVDGDVKSCHIEVLTEEIAELDKGNFYLTGAITGETVRVQIGKSGYPSITIENGKASNAVLQDLKEHFKVTGQVEVRVGSSANESRLIGTSNIELKRTEA